MRKFRWLTMFVLVALVAAACGRRRREREPDDDRWGHEPEHGHDGAGRPARGGAAVMHALWGPRAYYDTAGD